MSTNANYFDRRFKWGLLHPKFLPAWLGILLLLLFALLPAKWRDPIAKRLAKGVIKIAKKPMKIARANLRLCFPDYSSAQIEALVNSNVENFVMILLGQGELLLRSDNYLRQRIQLSGLENLQQARQQQQPIIFIMPHVWGIDYAGLRLNLEVPLVTMAKAHRNGLFNWFNNLIRSSRGGGVYMREAGIRALLSELKQDNSFFYLPDEDLGPDKSVFAPFLGTTKATLPVVGRLAKAGNAQVMPVKIGYNQQTQQFELSVLPAIEPATMQGKDNEALALNKAVEQVILAYPEQYMWFLKVLKTRPPGEPPAYD